MVDKFLGYLPDNTRNSHKNDDNFGRIYGTAFNSKITNDHNTHNPNF